MKHTTSILVAAAFLLIITGAVQAKEPRGLGLIKNRPIIIEGGESARMTVVFQHRSHNNKGIRCKNCHHESSSDIPYSACRDCHSTPGARERDPMSMFMAFHAKGTDRSCLGCHTRLAEESPHIYKSFKGCRPCHMSPQARAAAAR